MIATDERAVAPQLRLHSLLETIVSSIARRTKVPEIIHYPNDARFTVEVDPYDQGRFVGRLGSTIWGIQTIFWYAGLTQFGWSYSVKLMDHPLENRRSVPFKLNPKWDRKKIENLIGQILDVCLKHYCSWSLLETGPADLIVNLKLMKYLKINLTEPDFVEAFDTVVKVAGLSNGVRIITEATWE
jgi:predicted RNA-binding protein YlqC (UPF0109 family)